MIRSEERGLLALVIANVVLQVFDGIATFVGLSTGLVDEGNPILNTACGIIGVAPTLVLSKLVGIALVFTIWRLRESWLAAPALAFTATFYVVISVMPWVAAAGMLP
jgi:hypothetical protein